MKDIQEKMGQICYNISARSRSTLV